GDGDAVIVRAVPDPDRLPADRLRERGVRILRADDAGKVRRRIGRERIVALPHHLAGDRHDGREELPMPRHVPHARPSHRDAGEIDAAAVAAELFDALLERGEGLLLLLAVPLLAEAALREDDDG